MSNNAKNLPEVKLGQYKGLAVTRHVRPLSEKTIDQEMVDVYKRQVMDDFKAGRLDALVSTTVIEVGVDVPNATVMVIEKDVYKRQILEGAVERMRDWGSFLQHCQLLALVLGADERAGGGQAADTVAVGVGKLQRFQMCIRDSLGSAVHIR